MYNISEKIANWYKTQKSQPIVSSEEAKKDDTKTVNLETESKVENSKRNELKDKLVSYNTELENLVTPSNDGYALNDKEIDILADKEAKNYFSDSYEKENVKNSSNVRKINAKIEDEKASGLEKEENINKNYLDKLNKTTDEAIKNKISRSSIYDKKAQENENNKNSELELNEKNVERVVNDLKLDLADEGKRHAVELESIDKRKNEKKEDIKSKLYKEREEGIKNGTLIEKGEGAKLSPEQVKIYQNIKRDALAYYFSMDKETAIKEFDSDYEIQELLGKELSKTIRAYISGEGTIE